jgi:hypothetical protein
MAHEPLSSDPPSTTQLSAVVAPDTNAHLQSVELAKLKGDHDLAVAREQTAQVRIRYVVGASIVAFLSLVGAVYKAYLSDSSAQAQLEFERAKVDLESARAKTTEKAQRFAFDVATMNAIVAVDADARLPRLRYLAKGDVSDALTKWADAEIVETKALITAKEQANNELRKAQQAQREAERSLARTKGETAAFREQLTAQLKQAEDAVNAAAAKRESATALAAAGAYDTKPCLGGRRASLVTEQQLQGEPLAQVERLCQTAAKKPGIPSGGGREAWRAGTTKVDGVDVEYWCSCLVDLSRQ